MTAVKNWSRTAAGNNSAPPDGFPEGQLPGTLNDAMREVMAAMVNEAVNGECRLLASVAGSANAITASCTPDITAYNAGMLLVFTPASNNTAAATIAIDGLTALDILRQNGDTLAAGDLLAGVPAVLQLDAGADDFILLNPQHQGARQNSQSGNYTLALTDNGKHIFYNGAGGHTYTIPANASVAFPIGACIVIVNPGAALTVAITSDTLNLAGSGGTGSRTLAAYSFAVLLKVTSTVWIISGVGVT